MPDIHHNNIGAIKELQACVKLGEGLVRVIDTIGVQLENATALIGRPQRVIFSPDTRKPLYMMESDILHEALSAAACCMNIDSNDPRDIIAELQLLVNRQVGRTGTLNDGTLNDGALNDGEELGPPS